MGFKVKKNHAKQMILSFESKIGKLIGQSRC